MVALGPEVVSMMLNTRYTYEKTLRVRACGGGDRDDAVHGAFSASPQSSSYDEQVKG